MLVASNGLVFGGGEGLHRQRVDLLAHSIAEGLVDPLVALDAAAPLELGRDDGREEMPPVAFHGEVLARQALLDELLDLLGGRLGHRAR